MSIWGVENGTCAEELLSPLGLVSYGGGTLNNKMSYIIYSKLKNNKFKYEIEFDKLKDNIEEVKKAYQLYLRKEKILKIKKNFEAWNGRK